MFAMFTQEAPFPSVLFEHLGVLQLTSRPTDSRKYTARWSMRAKIVTGDKQDHVLKKDFLYFKETSNSFQPFNPLLHSGHSRR